LVAAIVWSLALSVLILGLAACGSKEEDPQGSASDNKPAASQSTAPAEPPAAAPSKPNAAEFLTKADAEAVLGKSVGDPTVQDTGINSSNVTYLTADFKGIALFVRTGTTSKAFDDAQAAFKSKLGVDATPIEGLGEKAFWAGGKLNQLNVLKNGHWLIITIPLGGETAFDLAKQAAEKTLARVP
jgi:hypothetical protein